MHYWGVPMRKVEEKKSILRIPKKKESESLKQCIYLLLLAVSLIEF